MSVVPPGRLVGIGRFPVKSLGGEQLSTATVEPRGLVGDRTWAVRDDDGKLGSGKSTRRFRRMPGLLDLSAQCHDDLVPVVRFPDGRRLRADRPEVHQALSGHVGRPVTLAREDAVSHFDEGPLHLLTLAALARAGDLDGAVVDPRRVRPNLLVDTSEAPRFDERDWVGRTVRIGSDVLLKVRTAMTRCVMVDLPQADLPGDGHLLGSLGAANDSKLGLVVDVLRPGVVELGDAVVVEPAD